MGLKTTVTVKAEAAAGVPERASWNEGMLISAHSSRSLPDY